MKRKELLNILFLTFLLIFIFFLIMIFWLGVLGELWKREYLGKVEYFVNELENTTIMFNIDKLITGKHELQIYFVPYDDNNVFQQIQEPISFEFTVQVQQRKKVMEKTFKKIFEYENSRGVFFLFNVPSDFLWSRRADIKITITDIKFNEEFTQYFQKVSFYIVHLQLLGK